MEQFQVVTSGSAAASQSPAQVAVSSGGTNEQVAVMQGIPSAVQVSGAQVAQLSPQPQVINFEIFLILSKLVKGFKNLGDFK